MFLMWIVPLLLVGLLVYVISGNNPVNALKPVANWLIVGIIGILALLFLFGGGMISGWGYGNYGYRGWGMMGPGMMGWGYSPLGWISMLFMWLIPIGVITLIIFGIAALVRNSGNPTLPSSQSPCPNCAKNVQADWQNCPYCGTALK